MPIHEYTCTACGANCEILQRLSDDPERVCPSCGAETLVKQISAAGFRLKGTGWYETDFKSGDKHNLVDNEPQAKPADAKTDSASDKAAVKPDTKSGAKSDPPAKVASPGEKKPKATEAPKATPVAPGST